MPAGATNGINIYANCSRSGFHSPDEVESKRSMEWNVGSIFLLVMCNLYTVQAQSDWGWGDVESSSLGVFPMRTEMACEDYPLIIRCPGHDVIQIVSAEYGRRNSFRCSASTGETENINCALPQAKDIVKEKCNNQTHCTFQVSKKNFPDPCPGTRKYLETKFNCVRYMFSCPGSLTGIGEAKTTTIDVRPQPGTWTKDALFNTEHVYFAPFGQTVYEYSNWETFASGTSLATYTLPSDMAAGNLVVHDRNLYYVEENSRTIVRYNLITKTRTKDLEIPDPPLGRYSNNVSLAVDEQGLWVVYTKGKGLMSISKLDKNLLTVMKTWDTNRRMSQSAYTFFICGVMYSASSLTGTVDYSFNTNLKSNHERLRLGIQFDSAKAYSRLKQERRSRLPHGTPSVLYNPRDQLLYLWDAENGNAIYRKLHFDGRDPAKAVVTTTTTSTTSTTQSTTTSRAAPELATTGRSIETPVELFPPDAYRPMMDACSTTSRSGLNWPKTRAGQKAKVACPDGNGDFGFWRCVRESSMVEAAWHVAGPDLSKCIIWASEISSKYKSGLIDRSSAFDLIAAEVSAIDQQDGKWIRATAGLVEKLLEDATLPSQENAKIIAESMASISGNILSNEGAMEKLHEEQRMKIANVLKNATERAGFIYAETIALSPMQSRELGPFVVSSSDVLMQIEVRERHQNAIMMSSSMTSFPDTKTCSSSKNCESASIRIPESEIQAQGSEGPVIIVFSLYANIEQYLSREDSEWSVDSKVISATLQQPDYQTKLNSPAVIVLRNKNESLSPRRCVYWDNTARDSAGNWSEEGCRLVNSNATHTTCECNHLTSFAVLVNHQGVKMEAASYHDRALDIVTKVGISISIVCLAICVLTFVCFRNLENNRNTIHKHLCISLLVAETIFLVGIDQTGSKIACSVVAGLLHYFFLAAFMWMALEGFQLYVMLVEVFESDSRWKWYYLTGYGIPAIIVGISAAVDRSGYGTAEVCWLRVDSGFVWSFVGPVLLVILANVGFLGMTLCKMYFHTASFTDSGNINSIKASLRGASVLLCLLGITWAFGILWISEEMAILAYLFCIFNAFQGMFIFIFHCLLSRKVRQEYRRCLSRLSCCQKLYNGTYVGNSSSFSKPYSAGRYAANGASTIVHQPAMGQSQLRRMWNETVAPQSPDLERSAELSLTSGQNKESIRPTTTPGKAASRRYLERDQNYLHEDEVFLSAEAVRRTEELLNCAPDDRQYDRLQHHHHAEEYLDFQHGEARPLGNFNTGQAPKGRYQHNHCADHPVPRMGLQHHLGPSSISQSALHNVTAEQPTHRHSEAARLWESGRRHYQPNRRSLDENFNGKRDSGIGLQRPSPNSGSEHHRAAPFRRSLDDALVDQAPHFNDTNRAVRTKRNSLEENENQYPYSRRRSGTMDPALSSRCTIHSPLIASLKDKQPGAAIQAIQANGHRKRKSLSSDSDDPIVTDCSVSSGGSSGHRSRAPHKPSVDTSYYEEPICRKRMLPDPAHADGIHRGHWHPHPSDIPDAINDKEDMEVEMITSSDNSMEHKADTMGYPPYRPPSPPKGGVETFVTVPGSSRFGFADTTVHSASGMALTQHTNVYGRSNHAEKNISKQSHRNTNKRRNDLELESRHAMTGF